MKKRIIITSENFCSQFCYSKRNGELGEFSVSFGVE
jgi:hypothetical protein